MTMTNNSADAARQRIVARLRQDLMGPLTEDEILHDSPSEIYMTGILFAQKNPVGAEEAEEAIIASDEEDEAVSRVPPDTFLSKLCGFVIRSAPEGW